MCWPVPLLRRKCARGTGQIYKFVPLFATTSNGYIGRNETTLLRRIQGHKNPNSECKGLSNAIKKHGLDQFAIMLLETDIPVTELAAAEARLVEEHDTYHHGYNLTPGGEAPPLLCPSIVAKVKATKNTPESRAKTSKACRRHWDDPVAARNTRKRWPSLARDPSSKERPAPRVSLCGQIRVQEEAVYCAKSFAEQTRERS